jgi:heme/copper-type cytochrome/quinol oxidase subunit 1
MGAVFSIFAGMIQWWPLISGFVMEGNLLIAQFIVMFLGVKMTFFPQHFLGLAGMPRRYVDYADGFTYWNGISSIGSFITVTGVVMFCYIL